MAANSARVTVSPTGGADYRTLEEAVGVVPSGATIVLSSGTHVLSRPIGFSGDIVLEGVAPDKTFISSEDEDAAIIFAGGGRFEARDLSFSHLGSRPNLAAVVIGGNEARFTNCGFGGGIRSQSGDAIGAGMAVMGNGRAAAERCFFMNNQGPGVYVKEQGSIMIRSSICQGNGLGGIYIENPSRTQSMIERNTCSANSFAGIFVAGQSEPSVSDNDCRQNEGPGIVYADGAAGTASMNRCEQNSSYGIMVMGTAAPSLLTNTCIANSKGGIGYERQGRGIARQNTCRQNASGIYVGGQASPTLEANVCEQNQQAGIGYMDSGAGSASNNRCDNNGRFGIYVDGSARPKLAGNSCRGNQMKDVDDRRSWLSRW